MRPPNLSITVPAAVLELKRQNKQFQLKSKITNSQNLTYPVQEGYKKSPGVFSEALVQFILMWFGQAFGLFLCVILLEKN